MTYSLYVSLQGDDKILRFAIDPDTGRLEPQDSTTVTGGPAPMAIHPSGRFLYASRRGDSAISSFAIDQHSGALSPIGAVSLVSDSCFLATDRAGRFLLSAYYAAGHVAIHRLGNDGAVSGPPLEWLGTAMGSHSIQTDPSNRFVFVPHIADRGPNEIRQFRFDAETGRLTPAHPAAVHPGEPAGPRHFCFHPNRDLLYFCNEQGCSVTAYAFDAKAGTLAPLQTVSTLPDGFSGRNTCAEIRITPSGRFLYASNRGHNSIACFAVDAAGALQRTGHAATEAVPRAFSLDPSGRFLYAAGLDSGRLVAYRIAEDGALQPLDTYAVGAKPMWVSIIELKG